MDQIVILMFLVLLFVLQSRNLRKFTLTDLTVIAVLTAASSLGRALMQGIPSVQPSSFIIITVGMLLGPAAGYITGIFTVLISSLFCGYGTYVWWQMLGWGVMGLLAGYLPKKNLISIILAAAYGVVWGYIYGWITNLWWLFSSHTPINWTTIAAGNIGSLWPDTMHAVTNGVLLILLPYKRVLGIYKFIVKPKGMENT